MASTDKMMQTVSMMHFYHKRYNRIQYLNFQQYDDQKIYLPFGNFGMNPSLKSSKVNIIINSFVNRDETMTIFQKKIVENLDLEVPGFWVPLEPIVPHHPKEFLNFTIKLYKMMNIYYDKCIAEPIKVDCSS